MTMPKDYQVVEILVNGQWIKAIFHPADSSSWVPEGEEDWWTDYFMDEKFNTYPKDTQSDDPLPEWRSL